MCTKLAIPYGAGGRRADCGGVGFEIKREAALPELAPKVERPSDGHCIFSIFATRPIGRLVGRDVGNDVGNGDGRGVGRPGSAPMAGAPGAVAPMAGAPGAVLIWLLIWFLAGTAADPELVDCSVDGSCSAVVDQCRDVYDHEQCHAWAQRGECRKNPGFMESSCRQSCGACAAANGGTSDPFSCRDKFDDCEIWCATQPASHSLLSSSLIHGRSPPPHPLLHV